MNAEIISVGTEIILGNIINTHSRYLSRELAALGVNVYYQTAVGDNDSRFKQILGDALGRSDVIFLTGGLGPTTDDITKETACELLGITCRRDEAVERRIKQFFARMGRVMSQNNIKQAMVPEGAVVLENEWGTAPGFIIEKEEKTIVLLPGPPRELEPMFEKWVKPYFREKSTDTIVSKNLNICGIGESVLEERLGKLVALTNPTVALYAKTGEVQLRITAKAPSEQEAAAQIDKVAGSLQKMLGDFVYGIDAGNMETVLVAKLAEKGRKIAVAESCTGGLIAQKITSVPGASEVFGLGIVSYANAAKNEELGVLNSTLARAGAVSRETAVQMAKGIAMKSGADYSIAVTGIAGPGGGTEEKPVGTVYVAVEHGGNVWCKKYNFARYEGERDYVREVSALNAMNMVRLTLQNPEKYGELYE